MSQILAQQTHQARRRLIQAAGGDRRLLAAALEEFRQLDSEVSVRVLARYLQLNRKRWREFGDLYELDQLGLALFKPPIEA